MKAELNQEAVDNEVFSKAVKVNAVALSAVKSFLEVVINNKIALPVCFYGNFSQYVL